MHYKWKRKTTITPISLRLYSTRLVVAHVQVMILVNEKGNGNDNRNGDDYYNSCYA